jgi:hypothetical protein
MALPSRKALVERINQLESDIAPLAAAAGLGYVGGRLVPVATVARGAAALSPVGAALLLADLAIREEQSLAFRGGTAVQRSLSGMEPGSLEDLRPGGLAFSPSVPITSVPRRKSSFNRAVSVGMKAVKASKAYGPKGKITGAKRAFSAVTKIASKIKRGLKVSRTGTSGIIARAVSKVLKKPKKVTRVGGR